MHELKEQGQASQIGNADEHLNSPRAMRFQATHSGVIA